MQSASVCTETDTNKLNVKASKTNKSPGVRSRRRELTYENINVLSLQLYWTHDLQSSQLSAKRERK